MKGLVRKDLKLLAKRWTIGYLLSFYMPSPSPLPISEMQIYMRFNPRYSFLFF